jgi:hypothetical protein
LEENATGAEIQKAIKDYLIIEKKLVLTSRDYASQFSELYAKVKSQKTA